MKEENYGDDGGVFKQCAFTQAIVHLKVHKTGSV